MKLTFTFALVAIAAVAQAEAPPPIRELPDRPASGPYIRLVEMEVLPDCPAERVCADGIVENYGSATAYAARLRVEIGAVKLGKPRASFIFELEQPEMAPGERQEFSLMINRKYAYKNAEKKDKIIEVGRYNFRIVPLWSKSPPVAKRPKK
jgi:hypothetical protein